MYLGLAAALTVWYNKVYLVGRSPALSEGHEFRGTWKV